MKKNMGAVDRGIRTLVGVVIAVLYFTGRISGPLALVLGVIAVAFLVTSFLGHCPGYTPLKFSTRKDPPGSAAA